jgi:hypothetical protein
MSCSQKRPPFYCPTHDDLTRSALHLIPQGRIWGNNDGFPAQTSVIYRFWQAVTEPFYFLHQRLCALREEFFCKTQSETNDLWLADYGLPDACDPFADLCVKVSAQGGATCDYLKSIALSIGWDIDCSTFGCGGEAGCIETGLDPVGQYTENGSLIIIIKTNTSPAYQPVTLQAEAGCYEASQIIRCDPFEGLRCVLERIIHAHVRLKYTILEI